MTETAAAPRKKGISGSTLKIIAIFAMLIDHIGAIFLSAPIPYYTFRLIGRVAFPIFAFLLVEGFFHTKNLTKYCLRLAFFALISEIPFDLAFHETMFCQDAQNVFFTLFIGLLTIACIDYVKNNLNFKYGLYLICRFAITATGMFLAWYLNTDYGEIGILAIVLLYSAHENRIAAMIDACIVLLFLSGLEISSLAAIPLAGFYNEKRGISLKYVFYLFYPVHLLLLYLANHAAYGS